MIVVVVVFIYLYGGSLFVLLICVAKYCAWLYSITFHPPKLLPVLPTDRRKEVLVNFDYNYFMRQKTWGKSHRSSGKHQEKFPIPNPVLIPSSLPPFNYLIACFLTRYTRLPAIIGFTIQKKKIICDFCDSSMSVTVVTYCCYIMQIG